MALYNLYSKRQKKLRGEVPETYTYDELPRSLRYQIVHIIQDMVGEPKYEHKDTEKIYKRTHDILCREYGKYILNNYRLYQERVLNFFLETVETEEALDVVEIAFLVMNDLSSWEYDQHLTYVDVKLSFNEATFEINERFKESGVGYQLEQNQIIRLDSAYMHSAVVKQALTLLWNKKFLGANDEFLTAHEHYRHGRNKECLNDCLKAFESTLKIICTEKKWSFNESDTARKLIQVCFNNGLVPSFTQNQFTSLQNLLESGIPTIRNKLGGHGQGQVPQKVDDSMTRYALNLTGANIIFLIEQSGSIE